MVSIASSIGLLLKVVITFLLLYWVLPYRVVKNNVKNGFDAFDRFFICLINMNLVTIIIVHFLVLIKQYETFSLLICYIFIAVLYARYILSKKNMSIKYFIIDTAAKSADVIESFGGIKKFLITKAKGIFWGSIVYLKGIMKNGINNPVGVILLLIIFVFGIIVRFRHSILYLYYNASDAYVHLTWVKYLASNRLYVDGVYPLGYNAIISALNKIFYLDPYVIIRFIGALGGCLIVFSVYYFLRKQFSNKVIPVIMGVAIYVFCTEMPFNLWRQMSALPSEYAMIFLLPGIYYLQTYFDKKNTHYLILAAEVLALTLLIHLYVAVIVAIAYVLVCLFNVDKLFKRKVFIKLLSSIMISSVIGILPLAAGFLVGIPAHEASIDFINSNININGSKSFITRLMEFSESNLVYIILLIVLAITAIYTIIRLFASKGEKVFRISMVTVVMTLFLYAQYRSEQLGIPYIMDKSRIGIFLEMFIATAFAAFVCIFDFRIIKWPKIRAVIQTIICVTVFSLLFSQSNLILQESIKLEYNEAAYAYMKIKSEYPVLGWTIVSPTEQYSEVLGYGSHYQLWQFVADVNNENKTELVIPTEYVFWYIEKLPLNSSGFITRADADKPMPYVNGDLSEYYTVDENRRIVQAKAYYWLLEYMKINSSVSIFMETENMTIYMMKQDMNNLINFKSSAPVNY